AEQQEAAERRTALVAERRRTGEAPAVDHRARKGGDNRGDMADVAADGVEEGCANNSVRCSGQCGVTRWRFRSAHEAGEGCHIRPLWRPCNGRILRVWNGVESGDRDTVAGVLGRLQWAR